VGWGQEYRYEATTVEGFVQQLAVSYLKNGYWFYVPGEVPAGKEPRSIDDKLLGRYGIGVSKWAKARASKRGEAKLQYLRYERTFLMLATHGESEWFIAEKEAIYDARERPIRFYGYSVGYKDGHPHVRIASSQYRALTDAFLGGALALTADALAGRFRALPFEPYGPVRAQLRKLLVKVNRARREAGLGRVPVECLRTKRRVVKPFAVGAMLVVSQSSNPRPDLLCEAGES